jgi:type IV secretory pathway TraG/TraD family ATPase VirD4
VRPFVLTGICAGNRCVLGFQGIAQIRGKYGDADAQTTVENATFHGAAEALHNKELAAQIQRH